MKSSLSGTAFSLALAVGILGAGDGVQAQSPEALCVTDETTATLTPESNEPLKGRLGGTREEFEARFGPPSEESDFSISYDLEGCGWLSADYEEDILTTIRFTTPDYLDADAAEWTFDEAQQIAARVVPLDVEMGEPFRNVSFVEHQPCFSEALAARVPMSVYSFIDNNPTPGQCSVVYDFDDSGDPLSITVQLDIQDPN